MKRSSTLVAAVIGGLLLAIAVVPGASAVNFVTTIDAGIGEDPQPIAISSDGSTAVVGSEGSVQIIDTTSNAVITSVPSGYFYGYGSGFSEWEAVPGTTWFAGVHGGMGIALFDAATATSDPATLSIWGLIPPYGIEGTNIASLAVSADGQTLWAIVADASNDDAYDIAVWDLPSGDLQDYWSVTSWTSIDDTPPQLSVSPDGATGYALFPGAFDDSEMLVLDMIAQSVTTKVSIDDDVTSMAMSPDGQQIFVTSSWNDTVLAYGAGGTEGSTVASVHDANQVAFTPDSNFAYVTSSDHVHMISTQTFEEIEKFDAGESPYGLAVTPDGTQLYVTNNIDNGTVTVMDIPAVTPASQQITGTVGDEISTAVLTASGFDGPTQFALEEGQALPAGLALDPGTGQITGIPTEQAAAQSFTIYATETGGDEFAVATVTIAIDPDPTISPSTQTLTARVGTSFRSAPLTPLDYESAPTFSISPSLPAGLSLDAQSGVVSGTPTAATTNISYTITGTSGSGAASALLSLSVAPRLAPGHQQTGSIDVGLAFTSEVIETEGFAEHPTFSVSPALPDGLTLDPSNGVVSGTASTALRELFTLTATEGGVSGTASLLLTFDPLLSVLASYVPLTAGTAVDSPLFTAEGFPGPVTYTVEPALPPGLRITEGGALVGTPTSASDFSTYVVTAASGRWRESGITHLQVAPALDPGHRDLRAGVGQDVAVAAPRLIGFPGPVRYSVAPDLPAGLRLDASTGRVLGTPSAGQPPTTFTLTASGGGFSATTALDVSVATVSPATQDVTGRAGTPLSSARMDPKWFGGPVTYTVTPTPPNWLRLDPTTGVLTGTPTAAVARETYVIAATDGVARTDASVVVRVAAAPAPKPGPAPAPNPAPAPIPAPEPTSTPVPTPTPTDGSTPGASPSSEPSPTPSAADGASSSSDAMNQTDESESLPWVLGGIIGFLVLAGAAVAGTMVIASRRNGV